MRLDNIETGKNRPGRSFSIMQWSLFATCVFFCSGHWYFHNINFLSFNYHFFSKIVYKFTALLLLHSVFFFFSGVRLMVSATELHL